MKRRKFLALAGAGVAFAATRARAVQSSRACYSEHKAKTVCVSGFVDTPEITQIDCPELGWAACLHYMLTGYGADLTLDAVLARFGQDRTCRASDDAARLRAAAGAWRDDRGRRFLVEVTDLPSLHETYPDPWDVQQVTDRLGRQPVLCGAAGHTTLITEIRTGEGAMVSFKLEDITVRDPWRGAANLRALTAAERTAPFYVLALSVRALPGG